LRTDKFLAADKKSTEM